MQNAYADSSALSAGASASTGIPEGTPAGALLGGAPMATLFSAQNTCLVENPGPACARNFGAENSTEALDLNSIALGGGAGDTLEITTCIYPSGMAMMVPTASWT